MGVPKFFRYISERYPCLCELVKDYQIPQFDNLYLDMNGIIHVCSHPDDSNPHFRISEEKIFQDIFHYIEVLFRMIKPLKVFYMAVDGVAPRAKMNQQRSRRFRTAKDAEKAESKAKESGEVLPTDAKFDSNCITPGTEFMTKLHEQLKYFVVNKVSMDPLWQKCTIIFSGHETPGEGEHKIMEYIRHARSQPGYDPNTRHCLYGLDADLIMLGLCTHEPHFSLLREEVRFGKKSQPKRKNVPEYIKFYLLHLSLMREYLELEFNPVKESLSFAFDIEKIIDDWVLMGFLVGNDFIPNLPNMHINNGALPLLYEAYMKVLPTLDGYINEAGTLNLSRFQSFLDHLSKIDLEHFNETYVDLKYMEEKTCRRLNDSSKLEQFMSKFSMSPSFLNNTLNNLFPDLNLSEDSDDGGSDDLRTEYDDEQFKEEFKLHKRDYYINKLDYEQVTPEVLKSQAEGYVRAIQWNLHYYYNGVCSWSWYYPHHYAPYISDIKNFSNVDFSFEIGEPFKPFEQLLAVLPPASKTLLPKCYHPLMTDDDSPLKKYYPAEFETDQNGKQQEWEAVVLVPFIEEDVLLKAMETCNKNLSLDELKRNRHGPMVIFKFTEKDLGEYEAPAHFPPIHSNHAEIELLHSIDVQVPKEKLIKGAYPGVKFDVYYPGFPTMKHLKYDGRLEKAKVKVFEQPSRNPSMMLIIQENENKSLELAVSELLGKTVFAGWPHLVEATVVSVSNEKYRYHAVKDGKYNVETNKGNMQDIWYSQVESFLEDSRNRMGIIVGNTNILVHVKLMTGRKCLFTQHGRISVEKQWSNAVYAFPLQTIVKDIACYNAVEVPYKNVEDLFPLGSYCFMLGQPHYGCIGKIIDSRESLKKGRLKTEMYIEQEPDFSMVWDLHKNLRISYMSLHDAAAKLGISKYLLSRLTGTILVLPDHMKDKKVRVGTKLNIGLNLKFNKKNEEIPGYTKKIGSIWYYSDKVISLMKSYMEKFPVIFGFLSANANRDDYYFNELFPGDSAQERVQEVANWISSQDYAKIDRKSCGLCVLEPEVIQHLQKTVDEFKAKKTPKKPVIMQVKPYLLYNSNVQSECLPPDPASTFELFDRVVNVRPGYTVPVGLTGTIIAIHKTADCNENDILYDILFDKEFAGGFDFGTSSCQGYRLTRFALINKSFGQRQFEQRTGKLSQQNPSVTNQRPSNTQSFGFAKQSALPQHNQGNSAFVSCWQNQKTPYNHQPQQQWRQTGSATQNLNDVANKTVPSRQINPIHNFFMPSFGSKPDKDVTENKQDTDLLKKVLGISSGSNEENKPSSSNQKVNAHATPKQHKITAASELTRYYQNKNWGVPQYQYYPLSKNKFICQIVTKDGNMLCSEPKRTKEEACENLAQKYIKFLETNNKCVDIKLPVPPPQWCQANTSAEKPSEKKKERNATVPPFVPLQAVRQQKQKQNRTVNKPQHTDEDNLNNSGENHETGCLHDNKLKQIGGEKVKNKRKRERKIRIAANFSNAMDN